MKFYPFLLSAPVSHTRVSIPNGMEFYDTIVLLINGYESFNSQWDGILRIDALAEELKNEVSIPNGMEFYHIIG